MNGRKPPAANVDKKRCSKVSFSEEVLSKDKIGDGNKVLVEEEHGVFLSLLGQRRIVTNSSNNIDGGDEIDCSGTAERIATISFGGDDNKDNLLEQKLAYSEKQDGNIIKSTTAETNAGNARDGVEYDNLIVKIGLLKIGHRYRMNVPVPNRWGQEVDECTQNNNEEVKIIEDSLDEDLRGEIETEYTNTTDENTSSTPLSSSPCQHFLIITLAAKRRGPYRGRFVLELTRCHPAKSSSKTPNKCIMSVQVDATIMGKDMGTPKLRSGVICLGKIVGYDSDDETEWQGFDC